MRISASYILKVAYNAVAVAAAAAVVVVLKYDVLSSFGRSCCHHKRMANVTTSVSPHHDRLCWTFLTFFFRLMHQETRFCFTLN